MTAKTPPRAATIRRILDRGGSRPLAGKLTGASRQAVADAAKHRRPRGRPPVALPRDRLTIYVKQVTALRLSDAAHARKQTVGELVDTLSEPLRTPSKWAPCKLCGAQMFVQDHAEVPLELERILTQMLTQEVTDRTPAYYHSSAAIGARVGLAYVLDRMAGHCATCGPWVGLLRAERAPQPAAEPVTSGSQDAKTSQLPDA
jgi:hypothetical protein